MVAALSFSQAAIDLIHEELKSTHMEPAPSLIAQSSSGAQTASQTQPQTTANKGAAAFRALWLRLHAQGKLPAETMPASQSDSGLSRLQLHCQLCAAPGAPLGPRS